MCDGMGWCLGFVKIWEELGEGQLWLDVTCVLPSDVGGKYMLVHGSHLQNDQN